MCLVDNSLLDDFCEIPPAARLLQHEHANQLVFGIRPGYRTGRAAPAESAFLTAIGCGEQVKWLSHRPAVELYDLRHDTFEKNNVAGQAEYAKIETRLGKALDHWMLQQGDLGIETELKARSRQAPGLDQIIKNKGISK